MLAPSPSKPDLSNGPQFGACVARPLSVETGVNPESGVRTGLCSAAGGEAASSGELTQESNC